MKYKINILSLRKSYSLLIMMVLSIIIGCNEDKILTEVPLDFLSPSNAYSNPAGAKQGIAGLNDAIRNRFFIGSDGELQILKAVGTDVAFYGEDPGGSEFLTNYTINMNPNQYWITGFWNWFYAIIQQANVLIDGISKSDLSAWANEAERNRYLAEAKFFRAFTYRFIVTLWGDVPLVDGVVNTGKTDFVRNPKADTYKLMEDDLILGTTDLPLPGQEWAPGAITQGAAWHLLSEVYLAQNKFQLAADAASHVINDYSYSLMQNRFGTKLGADVFGSGDVYYDLFVKGNQNLAENKEAIWVVQFEPSITGGAENIGERAFGCAYFRMGNTPDGQKAFRGELYQGSYTGYSDTLGRPVSWTRPTNYIVYDIWKDNWDNDIRNAKHSIKRDFYFDNPESIYDKHKIDFSLYPAGTRDPIKDTCQYIFPYFMKVASPLEHYTDPARSGGGRTHKDIYGFRLAETYLLRAEAYLGLGNKDLAAADINAVRNRASATPILPAQADLDFILDERARELYTEEFRMITLMRLGKLVERVRIYNNDPFIFGLNIQDFNNLWPIPQDVIDLNIGAKMEQNPGYN
jgi:starch-binding outer membrane protein, SusD/RagB family